MQIRGSHWRRSIRKLCSVTLLKKRLWHKCFPVNFALFLKARFLQKISGRLLLLVSQPREMNQILEYCDLTNQILEYSDLVIYIYILK